MAHKARCRIFVHISVWGLYSMYSMYSVNSMYSIYLFLLKEVNEPQITHLQVFCPQRIVQQTPPRIKWAVWSMMPSPGSQSPSSSWWSGTAISQNGFMGSFLGSKILKSLSLSAICSSGWQTGRNVKSHVWRCMRVSVVHSSVQWTLLKCMCGCVMWLCFIYNINVRLKIV